VPLYYVCRLAGQQVKVVLSGEGSDEVLAGYSFERWAERWDRAAAARGALPACFPRGVLALLATISAPLRRTLAAAAFVCDQRDVVDPITMTNYWNSAEKQALLHKAADWPDSLDLVRKQVDGFGNVSPLNQALGTYCQDWLVEDLLMKADRMSMGNSVELRTPFLDYRLVEWAACLPTRLKAGPSREGFYRSKEILRRYAEGRLPAEIIERPKKGFPVPVYDWLSNELSSFARDTLTSSNSRIQNWFDRSALCNVVESGVSPNADMTQKHRLWNLLILEIWMQKWRA
jgi:asparagine synthase (glutamine-hydrolysing)